MSRKFSGTAKTVTHGWSQYPLVAEEELIDWAGQLVCPYCGQIDQYHVAAKIVEPAVGGHNLTECIRTKCCDHKLAIRVYITEGALNVLP